MSHRSSAKLSLLPKKRLFPSLRDRPAVRDVRARGKPVQTIYVRGTRAYAECLKVK